MVRAFNPTGPAKPTSAPVTLRISSASAAVTEVIREALRLLEERDEMRKMRLGTLRKEISVGLDQLERGKVSEYDDQSFNTLAADIKAKGRKRLAAKKKPRV